MFRLLKSLHFWLQHYAERHSRQLLQVGLVVFSLFLAGTQFLPLGFFSQNALAAPASQKSAMQQTTITLDSVTVTVNTPLYPSDYI